MKNLKVIIPAAGSGVRLYPHTHTKPKAMVFVADKPIIGHILDRLIALEAKEVVIVVGYMRDKLEAYVKKNYEKKFKKISFVFQKERLGLGHAILCTKKVVGDSKIMIVLGDTIFKSGYIEFLKYHLEHGEFGSIGIEKVDNPENYGIVFLNKKKEIKKMIEKPKNSSSNLAIAGAYILNSSYELFKALEELMKKELKKNEEYELTDALQKLVQRGKKLKAFDVFDRFDCGQTKTLLNANRELLADMKIRTKKKYKTSVIIEPVAIGENTKIINSLIGPNVSIASNATINNSIIKESIIGSNSTISFMLLSNSVVGDDAKVFGHLHNLNIGDSSKIEY
ncbi:MAG: sugar phosphate nucleotidyltransferase [Candidatus Thermoplasmatota archaeon]